MRWLPVLPQEPDRHAETVFQSPSLVVTGASARHLLAMKVRAWRERDMEDIAWLVKRLGIQTFEEIRDIHNQLYPFDGTPVGSEERLSRLFRWESGRRSKEPPTWSL